MITQLMMMINNNKDNKAALLETNQTFVMLIKATHKHTHTHTVLHLVSMRLLDEPMS